MAEQQLTQEDLSKQPPFIGMPKVGPTPKQMPTPAPAIVPSQGMFAASEKLRPITPKKEEKVLYKEKQERPVYLGNLSDAENIFKNYADLDKEMSRVDYKFFHTESDRQAYGVNVKRDRARALVSKNQTIKQLTDSGVQQKVSDFLFGSFNDIVKQGGKVSKYLTKNQAGVDVIDEGKLRADFDKIVGAKGNNGGSYIKEFLWSQVASDASLDNIIAVYNKRDKISAAMPNGITKEQQQKFMLEAKSKTENKIKAQVKVQDKLLQDKVSVIKEKYSGEISSIQQDVNYYIDAAQQKVAKQLEGITGIYEPAFQESYNRRVKEVFDAEYAQYVMPKFEKVSNDMAAEIKTAMAAVNGTVKRIYKEANIALGEEFNKWQKEQNKQQAELFTKNVGSIIEEGIKERGSANKAYAESMIDMSSKSGVLGIATTGKIFGEAFISGYGSLKNKTALLFNALGYEADFLDEMRYSGKSLENKYSMEKLPFGDNWFKPGYWAQSIAQSGPSMAAGMLVTALTRNPYLGGIVSFATESVENSGGVMERVLENTGDLNAATQAAGEAFVKNTPTVISDVLFQRMFAPLSSLKALKQPVASRAGQLITGIVSEGATETWQAGVELSTGVDAKLGLGQALVSKEAVNAGIEGGIVSGILGGAGISFSGAYKQLFNSKNIPSARTQAIASTILTNGETAAMAGTQIDALANDIDDATLGEGMKEVADISKTINDAKQIGLNPQQTQVFASLSKELADLNASLNTVTDQSVRKVLQTQIAAKEKEIEGIVSGRTPIATIELQPGLAFTGTIDGVRNVMNVPEVKAEVEAGNVKIITEDKGLNAEVEQARTAPTRQRNIISDTGEIVGQVPTEAAPVTEAAPAVQAEAPAQEATPITQIKTQEDATQISERPQQEGGQPSDIVQREGTQEGQPQVGQAEGAVGETAQPAADTRNRNIGSQAQEIQVTANALALEDKSFDELQQVYDKLSKSTNEDVKAISLLVENVQEKKERNSILNTPLENVSNVIDGILQKEGFFLEQREAVEAKAVADKYSKEVTVEDARRDFKDAFFGRPESWVADALKMRESARVVIENGGTFKDLLSSVQKEFEADSFTEQDAAGVIKSKIEAITKKDFRQNQIAEQYAKAKADGSNPELVKAVEDLIGQPAAPTPETAPMAEAAPVTEAAPIDELLTADTKVPTNLEKVFNWLDGIDKSIDKNLKSGTLRTDISVIPLAAIQTMVKALKALVQGGMALQDAIKKVAADNNYTEKDVLDSIKIVSETEGVGKDVVVMSAREYIRDSISTQIKAIENVKDRANAIKEAVAKVIDNISQNYGAAFTLSAAAIKQLNKNLVDAVFSKMDDATAIDDVIAKVSPIVEYAVRRQMLSGTEKLLDKLKSNYKSGRYSGAARLSIMENLLKADASKWLNSNASLEDISLFNEYLKELTGKDASTANLDAAVALSNKFVPTPQQSTITEKDSLNNKINNLAQKAADGKIDFADYSALVSLEKAINDINERKGALTGLTDEERNDIIANYNKLISSLPKPIDQLLADAQAKIDADIKGKVGALGTAIETSQEFRDSIKNPFIYEAVLKFRNEMTGEFINSLTPKEKMLLSANIDEILRGNPNSTTYEFSAKAGAFVQAKTNYNIAKKIFSKRQVINNSGVTGFFGKVRRLFMDIDYNRASAERMAASFDLFKLHMMDVELNTGSDEFDMGDLEKKIFGPLARAIDSAFNKVTDSLGAMQEAMKLLNDKSNKQAIKKGIGLLNKELGTGFFGGKAKWMHIKKLLGYGNSFYMEISTRMATIVATQIDHISNLQDGESAKDVVLLRNILEQKPEDYDGRTMKEHYQTNPSAITDKTDDASLFDHIAYGILTKGGVNKLSDLTKDELLALLTESQKKAIAKWREHIDNTRNVVEAAMIMRGGVTAFLNEYFPRRVFSKDGVTEIKSIEEYINQAGGNVGVDSGQLKARSGEVGRLDLNGNSVLYNNLKDIYLIHEVKPILDSIKGLDNAVETLKKERDLGSATYAEAVSIAVANRVKNSLESNERISNNNYSFWYRTASKVSSIAARVILISQIRAVADFLSNVTKLSASLAFANKSLKNQIFKSVTPGINSYTTDKGTFKWDDYVKIALTTGSSVHRIMSNYADNFLYEFSKPKEQLQREQRVGAWQDMAVKKAGWMNKFEVAFQRITGESFDHKAFADERGAYRAMYLDSVQRASDAADSYIDRQYNLASIARQPIRVNIFAPFVGRASRNLFGKAPTIAKNNPASVILGFLTGYPTVQFQLFSRYMRRALSMDRDVSAKTRVEDISKALTEVIVPSIMYNVIRATTGILFTTTAAAVMAAGDDQEDRKRLYKEMEEMPFWKRWFAKTRIAFGEKEESLRNAVINGMLSSAIDPNVNALVRPFAGFLLFKMWKENAIEDMMTKGKTKKEIEEARQKIKEYENTLFESYSIRPIELFGTEQYAQSIKIHYGAKAQFEGVEDVIKSTAGFGILYNEVSRTMDLTKMINATDENQGLSETELYVASALKLGGVTFANMILGGKAGAALSMLSGDMNKVANMMISDQKSIQTGFEISKNKKGKKGGGSKKSRGGTQGRGGGARGGVSRGGAGGGAR